MYSPSRSPKTSRVISARYSCTRSVGELLEGDDEPLARNRRCVGKPVGLGDEVDDVHAEAIDAAVEPPAHDVVDGLSDVGVLPVQIRLLAVEQMEVVLAGGLLHSHADLRRMTPSRSARRRHGRPAEMYQSRFGLSRAERDSTNQGCSSEVWLTTSPPPISFRGRAPWRAARRTRPGCRRADRYRGSR